MTGFDSVAEVVALIVAIAATCGAFRLDVERRRAVRERDIYREHLDHLLSAPCECGRPWRPGIHSLDQRKGCVQS